MHPLCKLWESGNPTPAQVSKLLAENIVFNSPILVRPIEGRDVCAAIFAQSSATRGSGTYTAEFQLDARTTFLRWERLGEYRRDDFTSLDRPYQDRALEYDVFSKERAHLVECSVARFP